MLSKEAVLALDLTEKLLTVRLSVVTAGVSDGLRTATSVVPDDFVFFWLEQVGKPEQDAQGQE